MRLGIVLDPLFLQHETPAAHPERPDRLRFLEKTLRAWDGFEALRHVAPVPVDETWLQKVHSPLLIEQVRATAGRTHVALDADTYTSPRSYEVALAAAGSTVRLLELLGSGEIQGGFAAVRPPGHHAESRRAMGFCLFNNVAVAAEWALQKLSLKRVAVVDFDVHHGNGTQGIFYQRSDVLYISTHQYPFYPGTGHFQEVGEGEGQGYTVNFPIRAGMGNYFYCNLHRELIAPILREYEPQLILVSAGYDAHRADPLGGMELDARGFGEIVNLLNEVAQDVCSGRILYVLEGGYDLQALGECVLTTLRTCQTPDSFEIARDQVFEYEAYRDEIRKVLAPYWKAMGH